MVFSKSFGYAIRSILYLSLRRDDKHRVQLDEIARQLNIPRYFLGKVMHRLVKEGLLDAVKGHNGGFKVNDSTSRTTLATLARISGNEPDATHCALHLGTCNAAAPCPVHHEIAPLKEQWSKLLHNTTIQDLVNQQNDDLIRSIAAVTQTEEKLEDDAIE